MKKIGIVMGSDSDLPVVEKAMTTLDEFGVPYEVHVFSAHRTPVEARIFQQMPVKTAVVQSSQQQVRLLILQVLSQLIQHCP